MNRFTLLVLPLLAACAAPTAPPNPNSVPAILENLTRERVNAGSIYVTGGLYAGAAAGQTARFVVTTEDAVICTFQTDPIDGQLGSPDLTAHRENHPGLYAAMSGAILPNVVPIEVEFTTNFTVEHQGAGGLTITQTGFGDARFDQLLTVFATFPSPCWAFG